ncbi:MAG: shikimate kinase [Helicobacteraceae bacterium]|nr:shikimate kinase [Helicobacteraceae bacterium]
MNNLVLIGFMGSGKGTIGRLLARKTGRFFLDTDALIESFANRSIVEIFRTETEEAFRRYERDLAAWLARSVSAAVIATGGGMATAISRDDLRSIGETIYLQCDFATIARRLANEAEREKRPLAASIETLRDRFLEREAIYRARADRIIDANQSVEAVLEAIG